MSECWNVRTDPVYPSGTLDDGGSFGNAIKSILGLERNEHKMNNVHKWENPIMAPLDGIERTGYNRSGRNKCTCKRATR